MAKYLTILEVSQKQNYIFSSNKVRDNIVNSAIIAKVLSEEYLVDVLSGNGYTTEDNLVYSGGGHTILQFDDAQIAKTMVSLLTEKVYRDYDGLMIYAKTIAYDDAKCPKDNLQELTKQLENKKSIRLAAFKQGSYGIEKIDSRTLSVKAISDTAPINTIATQEYNETAKEFVPDGFNPVHAFEELGGTKHSSNFIAVVHIDGNGMGKRVEELYDSADLQDWECARRTLKKFSEAIDADFKQAYRDMIAKVGDSMMAGKIDISLKDNNFPIRRIITAGDDICFVTEGRIGIECARIFIESLLAKQNKVDHKGYSACAGVAIVHQKYPFYRAYELAEQLCSNAKKYGASISEADSGRSVSAIDWHIAFGELQDSLDETRRDYIAADDTQLCFRPYIINAQDGIMEKSELQAKKYVNFKKVMLHILKNQALYGTSKIKELRTAMKNGKVAKNNYLKFNRIENIANDYEETLFDAIELMDTFISVEGSVN